VAEKLFYWRFWDNLKPALARAAIETWNTTE
jgi:hypothetical protein